MSYRKSHIKNKIQKIKPKKSILKGLWFWIVVLFLLIVLFGSYFVLFYSGFQLKNITISGNSKVKNQDLLDIVTKYSHTGLINFWNVKIFSGSIFLVDSGKIKDSILERFSEIESISIKKKLPQTLTLNVKERKPIGIYCDKNNKCFLIDITGIVFEPQTELPVDISVVRQTAEKGQVSAGKQVVTGSIMSSILKIQKNLNDNFQMGVKEALIASAARLNVETDKNLKIYFDLEEGDNISAQLIKLDLLLNGGMSASEKENVKYIDLRPKDRAIICANSTCGE